MEPYDIHSTAIIMAFAYFIGLATCLVVAAGKRIYKQWLTDHQERLNDQDVEAMRYNKLAEKRRSK